MPPPVHILQNLVLIKEMFLRGKIARQEQTPTGKIAACHHYDISIEFILRTLCTHFDITLSHNVNFFAIWDKVDSEYNKKTDNNLPLKAQIKALRNARNDAQHHGTVPSNTSLQQFESHTESFLSDVLSKLFSINNLSEIFLSDLIQDEEIKQEVKKGENEKNGGNYKEAITHFVNAFGSAEQKAKSKIYYGILNWRITLPSSSLGLLGTSVFSKEFSSEEYTGQEIKVKFKEIEEKYDEEIRKLKEQIAIVSLGTDLRRLNEFRNISMNSEDEISIEDVKYCEEFVISEIIRWGV